VFVVFTSGDWLTRPTVLPALLYGIGIAASKTLNPTQARLKSLATHTVFGVGPYVCALGVSHVLRVHA
jgi:hypothetical protein